MVKVLANGPVKPLDNEYRNVDSMTEAQRAARYQELASADNPFIEVHATQVRGESRGMNPISNKPRR